MTLLADLTWPEAGRLAAAGALLAIPVGSTEQHGPHLPLSTDTDIAIALTGRLAPPRAPPAAVHRHRHRDRADRPARRPAARRGSRPAGQLRVQRRARGVRRH